MSFTKEEIIKEVYDGICRCARKHAINPQQEQDFRQEGLVIACEVADRYRDKEADELIRLIGTSSRNRILQMQKQEINWSRGKLVKTKKDNRPVDNWQLDVRKDPSDDVYDDMSYDSIDEREFVMVLSSFLSDRGKAILNEKINPGKNTITIMEREKREKLVKRESGALVMNVFTDKITDTHIAVSLGLSKATMSRELSRIKEVADYLLYGLKEQHIV